VTVREIFAGLFEVNSGRRNPAGNHAIRKARHDIWLEGDGRNVAHDGGGHGRAGGVSADADDDVGLELVEHPARIPDSAWEIERGSEAGGEAHVLERSHLHQAQFEPCGRNQAVFHAARGSDEEQLRRVRLLQLLGNGERGNDVSTGTAARQDYAHEGILTSS
jgi:hypothetical protein